MPLGKYSRVDGRKSSSSYGSTITIVVFVAVCMVGVWMMASPAVVPVQSSNVPQENNNEVKTTEAESNVENRNEATTSNGDGNQNTDDNKSQAVEEKQKQFEDNPGDLPEEATKSDSNAGLNQAEKKDTSSEVIGQNTEEPKLVNDEVKKEDKPINEPEKEEKKKTDLESQDSESRETNDSEKKFKEDSGKADEVKVEEKAEEKAEEKPEDKIEKTDEKEEEKPEDKIEKTDEKEEEKLEDKAEKTEEKPEDKAEKTDEKAEEKLEDKAEEKTEDKAEKTEEKAENKTDETKKDEKPNEDKESSGYVFPSGAQSELSSEPTNQTGSFKTQATQSEKEKDAQQSTQSEAQSKYNWKVCKTSAGTDYIPCLDNLDAIKKLTSTKHYEHRERHCPKEAPTCLVPLPEGYQRSIEWPKSREKIWYHNVPHTKLAEVKGHQNWVKVSGEYLTFPGGGTQFKHGALHYIDFIQQSVPEIAWGNRTRVVLDVGCGVASFGGFLFDRNALTMSLAPKDEHEAQVQFALERGIPAISAVMGTTRLLYPARVFDAVHCARCRVPWHIEGGKLLLELNRLLRPGGFFIWSATPIYQKLEEDVEIWEAMKQLTMAMCWDLVSVTKDRINGVGIAVYRKPNSNECYEQRSKSVPPLCKDTDDPNAAWNVPLQACMHKLPVASSERGTQWPEQWPARAEKSPYWLSSSEVGVYGKPAPEDFDTDCKHWKRVFNNSYLKGMGINWSTVRNAMDMRAVYGGLAAAMKDLNVWVMNVVSIDAPDTLPIIYERGLFGIYHDWCESFSTYPRSYDLLHADHLFSRVKTKCNLVGLVAEVDRILRPEGKIIIRDTVEIITELETIFKSMQWDIRLTFSKDKEGLLCAQKSMWRPKEEETLTYSIA